ncbi:pyrroloquinoline quinone biosynthesis protein PqqE [Chelativorans salis]|uniref:PqqA peptide cyclase n=1 Tax=Chelativorans salis TaxID=2978478 RepID=A0ABT2LJ62_9HYPH|nr:pyrroloquinoline quinone biosynthesis protein PqqE [Chelativorans sp. EGI FJ00035]MCT7374266.1 pyrroloquinoline quinone biosynthesis protein PqqE [Chelativorans sp. EGI FJ00035]
MTQVSTTQAGPRIKVPMAMLAELTHRCPLACPYCSNPVDMVGRSGELSTQEWTNVFRQAADLGVLHLHLSGGEPAARPDLEELVAASTEAELYSNLITSGVGLTAARLEKLAANGLDHLQLSLQGIDHETADLYGGYRGGFDKKIAVAGWTVALGLPLTINAVMHRHNLPTLDRMIDLAVELGARRLEVATVQFHGWAEKNKAALMPTREQVQKAGETVHAARLRLKGVLVIDYVPADYYATYPKACMGGWASTSLNVAPDGQVLPCHAAPTIPWLTFDNVRERPLKEIWTHSEAFNSFRGDEWMQEPCRSCARKAVDFGGCRCQAMALAGDAAATDPACSKSPLHADLLAAAEVASGTRDADLIYRRMATPKQLARTQNA